MKSLFYIFQKDLILIVCLFTFSYFLLNICHLFKQVESINAQTTEGFNNSTIEFRINSNNLSDFSFLDTDNSYAIVTKINDYTPIYRLIASNNLFFLKNGKTLFSYNMLDTSKPVYIRGAKADEICDLDPLIIADKTIPEWDIIQGSDVINVDYMIFICDKSYVAAANTTFLLMGDKDSIDSTYKQLTDRFGDKIIRLDIGYTSIQDVQSIDNNSFLEYFFVFLLVLCGFILLIYWWTLKYKETFFVGMLIGKSKLELLAVRDYLAIFTLSFFLAYLFNHKAAFISALITYALVIGLSTFVLIIIVALKPGELNYEKNN